MRFSLKNFPKRPMVPNISLQGFRFIRSEEQLLWYLYLKKISSHRKHVHPWLKPTSLKLLENAHMASVP